MSFLGNGSVADESRGSHNRVGLVLIQYDGVLMRRGSWAQTHRGRMPHEGGGRDGSDDALHATHHRNPKMPRPTGAWRGLE
jgi:hypothetical protein